ncbi:hypothetical protein EYZ11_002682 [Aspergillus tanneri]|uniref:Uncharacterized protein n=1 Tax=Aspergillus tanneri TaxID=1220188 RepID=A0A4S3JQ58_9EURO|nr:uncharacterized protein ATNIH1004_004019 [Aspergillus tanneri]KAA8648136.1 hypothetical protein ATNIH1004_004019 [Aspergillus tanneri]THC97829.1 hypothetical protein EYZ11_002682 [Aspergillus tanneri]
MSHLQGNAFAQMKAREKERQQIGEVKKKPEPSQKPSTGCKSNGLDYDQDLALPMPKPRHPPLPDPEPAQVQTPKKRSTSRARLAKRSCTDASAAEAQSGESRSSPATDSEKKKSKLASLRSKFSLKDIGKEFRKDSPPLSALPSLRKFSSSSGQSDEAKKSHASNVRNLSFDEERLYIPRARDAVMHHPSSAPPLTSTFREAFIRGKNSQSSTSSSLREQMLNRKDEESVDKPKISHVHDNNDLKMSNSETAKYRQIAPLDGSSPPVFTGVYSNTTHPESKTSKHRGGNMEVDSNHATPTPVVPKTSPAPVADICRSYSPSIYGTEDDINGKPKSSLHDQKPDNNDQHPLIVSSDQASQKTVKKENQSSDVMPTAPDLEAAQAQSFDHNLNYQMSMDEARFFAGVTSHGGFAPPPPHPEYQNTVTLEQLVDSHAHSIHIHMDTALSKLGRQLENNNNWSTDQVIRQVDSMTDVSRLLNSRTGNQIEMMKELHQLLVDLHLKVIDMQHESRQRERRLVELFHTEIAKMRAEFNKLTMNVSCNPFVGPRPSNTELQGPPSHTKATKEFDKRNKRKARSNKKEEGVEKQPESRTGKEHDQEGECVASCSLLEQDKRAEEQPSGDNNSTPTVSFRNPPTDEHKDDPVSTQSQLRKPILKNPTLESSGSPEQKATKMSSSAQLIGAPEEGQIGTQTAEPGNKTDNEEAKNSHKKGMFGFHRRRDDDSQSSSRFLRTPQRNKERKTPAKECNPTPSTPPMQTARLSTANDERCQDHLEESPSSVHPALRNPRQKQIMAERECQRYENQGRQPTGTQPVQNPMQQHSQRQQSLSHQSYSPRVIMPLNLVPNNQYGTSPIVLQQGQSGHKLAANYPHPHPSSLGQAPQAVIPVPYYGAHASASAGAGAPNVVMPPHCPQPAGSNTYGRNDTVDMRRWYQETRRRGSMENDHSYHAK